MKKISSVILTILIAGILHGQSTTLGFTSENWDLQNAELKEVFYKGKESIRIKGRIFSKSATMLNGTLEVDVNFPAKRYFPGIDFRLQDPGNAERFYIRPHQSGNPDANQYTPLQNGNTIWQFFYGAPYTKAIEYSFDEWHHIKIEAFGDEVKIYFDDMTTPIIHTKLAGNFGEGGFSLSSTRDYVHFANFQYEQSDKKTFEETLPAMPAIPEETISNWSVSQIFYDSLLNTDMLNKKTLKELRWTKRLVEPEGFVNFSKWEQRSKGKSTVVAKVIIESATNQIKKVHFGFSDEVRVHLNGEALFHGKDNFRSRDYRFLGTVGYFDSVFLNLKKGRNEMLFVVSEGFGGWGLQAKFQNMKGISLIN